MQPTGKFYDLLDGTLVDKKVPIPNETAPASSATTAEVVSSSIQRAILLVNLQAEMAALIAVTTS